MVPVSGARGSVQRLSNWLLSPSCPHFAVGALSGIKWASDATLLSWHMVCLMPRSPTPPCQGELGLFPAEFQCFRIWAESMALSIKTTMSTRGTV